MPKKKQNQTAVGASKRKVTVDDKELVGAKALTLGATNASDSVEPPHRLRVTTEAKRLATMLANMPDVDLEILEQHAVSEIQLKCVDAAAAQAQLAATRQFHALGKITNHEPRRAGDQHVNVHWEEYLPNIFSELITDLQQTHQAFLSIEAPLLAKATAFIQAYNDDQIIRASLLSRSDAKNHEFDECQEAIIKAHRALVAFLKHVVHLSQQGPIHRVRIADDLSVYIDGSIAHLNPSPKRALCCLARLRQKESFTCDDFMEFYDKNAAEPRKRFDKIMETLRSKLSHLRVEVPGKGIRKVIGLELEVQASDVVLLEYLSNYKK